jgi:hypothetical protein
MERRSSRNSVRYTDRQTDIGRLTGSPFRGYAPIYILIDLLHPAELHLTSHRYRLQRSGLITERLFVFFLKLQPKLINQGFLEDPWIGGLRAPVTVERYAGGSVSS